MERLLADAEKFSGVHYDINNLNDVYEAIHVVQGELHISGRTAEEAAEIIARTGRSSEEVYEQLGTTAEEASTTISGSFATMKSSWKNLLVGIADDNADVGKLVDDFVESVVTAGGNIIPRIESILGGLGELIAQAANKLVPIVVQTIIDSLPKLIESGVNLIVALNAGIWSAIPKLVRAIPDIIRAIVRGFVAAWPQLRQAGVDLINMVGDGIKSLASSAVSWGRDLIQNFIDGITSKLKALREKVSNIAQTVKNFLGFSEPKEGPLSNFHTYAPDMMELFSQGIRENEKLVTNQLEKSFDFGAKIPSFETNGGNNAHSYQNNSVVVNVYGAAGQNAKEIAKEVERIIAQNLGTKRAAWA